MRLLGGARGKEKERETEREKEMESKQAKEAKLWVTVHENSLPKPAEEQLNQGIDAPLQMLPRSSQPVSDSRIQGLPTLKRPDCAAVGGSPYLVTGQ